MTCTSLQMWYLSMILCYGVCITLWCAWKIREQMEEAEKINPSLKTLKSQLTVFLEIMP